MCRFAGFKRKLTCFRLLFLLALLKGVLAQRISAKQPITPPVPIRRIVHTCWMAKNSDADYLAVFFPLQPHPSRAPAPHLFLHLLPIAVKVLTAAFETLGRETGESEPVVSVDLAVYQPEDIRQLGVIIMNNRFGPWIMPTDAKKSRKWSLDWLIW